MLTFSKVDINKMGHVNVCYFIQLRMLCCKCFFRVAKTLAFNIFSGRFGPSDHMLSSSLQRLYSLALLCLIDPGWLDWLIPPHPGRVRGKGWWDADKQLKWSCVIMRSVIWSTLAPALNMKLNEDIYACRSRLKQRWFMGWHLLF